jgi:hypothetical protein
MSERDMNERLVSGGGIGLGYDRHGRIPAVERSPKTAPVVSAVRGIAAFCDRVISGNSHTQG